MQEFVQLDDILVPRFAEADNHRNHFDATCLAGANRNQNL